MITAEFLPYIKVETAQKKAEGLQKPNTPSNNKKSVSQKSDSPAKPKRDTNAGKTATKLAEKAQVSR